ncbi:hypothetical protein HS088_TW17G00442 [Tripterygium wilfordii]|uniref:Uncharacterized protein n=1 Tax=Tripterygium wilfordii TaxID=458696 RepID=A0A7J7CFJ6_TRIWF|nr:hypothetical protein HS088_TW17G00442 [Tripterygium wilfordii]
MFCGVDGGRCSEVHSLRFREDSAVADRTTGSQDAVQRLRCEVQVRPTGPRVPSGGKPDVRANSALELTSESNGAPEAEGGDEGAERRVTAGGTTPSPIPSSSLLTWQTSGFVSIDIALSHVIKTQFSFLSSSLNIFVGENQLKKKLISPLFFFLALKLSTTIAIFANARSGYLKETGVPFFHVMKSDRILSTSLLHYNLLSHNKCTLFGL